MSFEFWFHTRRTREIDTYTCRQARAEVMPKLSNGGQAGCSLVQKKNNERSSLLFVLQHILSCNIVYATLHCGVKSTGTAIFYPSFLNYYPFCYRLTHHYLMALQIRQTFLHTENCHNLAQKNLRETESVTPTRSSKKNLTHLFNCSLRFFFSVDSLSSTLLWKRSSQRKAAEKEERTKYWLISEKWKRWVWCGFCLNRRLKFLLLLHSLHR